MFLTSYRWPFYKLPFPFFKRRGFLNYGNLPCIFWRCMEAFVILPHILISFPTLVNCALCGNKKEHPGLVWFRWLPASQGFHKSDELLMHKFSNQKTKNKGLQTTSPECNGRHAPHQGCCPAEVVK